MEKCTACNGTGKQRMTVHTYGTTEEKVYDVTCVWCHGKGKLTANRAEMRNEYNNMWCTCKERHGSTFFDDGEHADLEKHHYRCKKCGKVTQIG